VRFWLWFLVFTSPAWGNPLCSEALKEFPVAQRILQGVTPADIEIHYSALNRGQRAPRAQRDAVLKLNAEDWNRLFSIPELNRQQWLSLLLSDKSPKDLSRFINELPEFAAFARESSWKLPESIHLFARVSHHSSVGELRRFLPELAQSYELSAFEFVNRWAKGFAQFPIHEIHETRQVFVDGVRGLDLRPWQALHMAAGLGRDITPVQFLERVAKLEVQVERVFKDVDAEIKTIQAGWTPWGAIRRMAAIAKNLGSPRSHLRLASQDRRLLNERFLPIFTALYSVDMTWTLLSDFGVRFSQGGMDQYLNEFGIVAMNFFTFAMCDAVLGFLSATRASTKMARQGIQDEILHQSVYLARGHNTPEFVRRGITLGAAGFGFATLSGVGVESYRYFVMESDLENREPLADRYLRVVWNAVYTAAFMGVWSNLRYNLIFDRLGPWLERTFFRGAPVRFNSTMTAVGVTNSGVGATTYVLGQGQVSDPLYDAFFGTRKELGVLEATGLDSEGTDKAVDNPTWDRSLEDLESGDR
jgi:hypothetical protein